LFYFLINHSFTLYELASVRFPLNEHVCIIGTVLTLRLINLSEWLC